MSVVRRGLQSSGSKSVALPESCLSAVDPLPAASDISYVLDTYLCIMFQGLTLRLQRSSIHRFLPSMRLDRHR